MNLNYYALALRGDQVALNLRMSDTDAFVEWTEENYEYVRYNPRKDVERYGLSITSHDGGLSGRPDLDSIYEYNAENNTTYKERDFDIPTPVYFHPDLNKMIEPWKEHVYRSHILKLNPGGFFPSHRDQRELEVDSFRLIIPLKNFNPPSTYFIADRRSLTWDEGRMYFLNTVKAHTLFNASFAPSYWVVLNVDCNEDTVNEVLRRVLEN